MQLPSNVSPVSASFIGLKRQGIHRVLCVACSFLSYSSVCGSRFSCLLKSSAKLKELCSVVSVLFSFLHPRLAVPA